MRYRFIRDNVKVFSIRTLCRVMKVCVSAYYDRARKPGESSDDDVKLRVQIRALFAALRGGAGRRTLVKKLRKEGMSVSRRKVMKLMKQEGLVCQQRRAYKVTTKARSGAEVAPDLLNQNFNPPGPEQVWASGITCLRTGEGWLYLATIMELYSRRIVWGAPIKLSSML